MEAVLAAVQADSRLVLTDLRGRGLEVGAADVGEVRGDDVDLRVERGQQVALSKVDALRDGVSLRVAAGEGKRRQLLEKAWADDGAYTDPQSDVAGRRR